MQAPGDKHEESTLEEPKSVCVEPREAMDGEVDSEVSAVRTDLEGAEGVL